MTIPLDPLKFIKRFWPHIVLYDKQAEILYSLVENDETVVPAGNKLGKDFVTGLAVIYFFLSRKYARVVTTSVDEGQLQNVLWGEVSNFLNTSIEPLPVIANHLTIKKEVNGVSIDKTYIIGRVAKKEEGLLGHHLARDKNGWPTTLMVYDEASGIPHTFKEKTDTWAHRTLVIGNPFPCENFFKHASQEGSIEDPNHPGRYYRKVIQIKAVDSPNVKLALLQQERGLPVTNEILIPGLLDYQEYTKRRATWDSIRQAISLDAEFYQGAQVLLYPPDWLNNAEKAALSLQRGRKAKAIGIDTAEGGDNTTMVAIDEWGLIDMVSKKTPDTASIVGETIAFMKQHGVPPEMVLFDRGGGGKQHADRLRQMGYAVRTVMFGEGATPEKKRGTTQLKTAKQNDETRSVFKNRRAEMYWILRELIDPVNEVEHVDYAVPLVGGRKVVFALPDEMINAPRRDGGPSLRKQLAIMPFKCDGEGRIYLPAKNKKSKDSKEECLSEMLGGFSPDEADALVLATFGLFKKTGRATIGAV